MKKQWYPIHDFELGTCTIIAPRTGHMVVSNIDYRSKPMSVPLGFVLGTSNATLGSNELQRACIIDGAAAPSSNAEFLEPSVASIKRLASLCLKLLPLSIAIMLMQLLFPLKRGTGIQIDEAVRHTAAAFGRRSNQDCLLISICRHVYLRRLGILSKILLGAHVPTEKMHAWVQIGDHPVLECPDVLVHYQACVAYL